MRKRGEGEGDVEEEVEELKASAVDHGAAGHGTASSSSEEPVINRVEGNSQPKSSNNRPEAPSQEKEGSRRGVI